MDSPPAYSVDDRSILLPAYRRWLVDPVLPFIPPWVHPNWITHTGHLACLSAVLVLFVFEESRGWPFAIAALLLQVYIWCDNADGAHARRVGKCSAVGEYLDHGLDILNTVYMGMLTAMTLGLTPIGWVVVTLLIPGAAAIVMWEQAATGVYRLGLINQVESSIVLGVALVGAALFGHDVYVDTRILGLELRHVLVLWCTATILFGVARGLGRVARRGERAALGPALALIAFGVLSAYAVAAGVLGTIPVVTIVTAVMIAFAARMLSSRLHRRPPRTMLSLAVILTVLATGLAVNAVTGDPLPGGAIATVAAAVLFAQTALDAYFGFNSLAHT
jgi:phosphatidylglycerophosphate synthase